MMKETFKKIIDSYLKRQSISVAQEFYSNAIRYNPLLKEPGEGEKEWLERWRQYEPKISPMGYRVFSRYIGNNIDIVPLEVCVSIVEPALTPMHFNNVYSDKNVFDILFPKGTLPKTFLRKIRGRYFDKDYNTINRAEVNRVISNIESVELIVKPAISSSGRGVEKFYRRGNGFENSNNEKLNRDYIDKYYKFNCIIQETFVQHDFFSQFNKTSVNSIRIVTYRDSDGVVHALNSFFRIGSMGSIVDNAHAGGMFVGIDVDGHLGGYVCDQFGRTQTNFNGIDFSTKQYIVPEWMKIKEKVVDLSKYVIHHDLIAWDAILDKDGYPHILEVNIGGYGGWAFQFTSGPMFGDYTDDVMRSSMNWLTVTNTKMIITKK